eukprot:1158302-Pelagomonas_calceolata.AAC.3
MLGPFSTRAWKLAHAMTSEFSYVGEALPSYYGWCSPRHPQPQCPLAGSLTCREELGGEHFIMCALNESCKSTTNHATMLLQHPPCAGGNECFGYYGHPTLHARSTCMLLFAVKQRKTSRRLGCQCIKTYFLACLCLLEHEQTRTRTQKHIHTVSLIHSSYAPPSGLPCKGPWCCMRPPLPHTWSAHSRFPARACNQCTEQGCWERLLAAK